MVFADRVLIWSGYHVRSFISRVSVSLWKHADFRSVRVEEYFDCKRLCFLLNLILQW